MTAAPLLRSRLAEDALSRAGPRRRLSHHRAGAHPQGRKQSINLPGRFLHPPPQTCLSPAPHSQGGPGHTPLTVPKPRSLCWAQHRISIRELTGRQSWQMGSLPAIQTQSIRGDPAPHPLPTGATTELGGRPVGSPEEMLACSEDGGRSAGTRQVQDWERQGSHRVQVRSIPPTHLQQQPTGHGAREAPTQGIGWHRSSTAPASDSTGREARGRARTGTGWGAWLGSLGSGGLGPAWGWPLAQHVFFRTQRRAWGR